MRQHKTGEVQREGNFKAFWDIPFTTTPCTVNFVPLQSPVSTVVLSVCPGPLGG